MIEQAEDREAMIEPVENARIDCPRCSGSGLEVPRVMSGPIRADAVGPCRLCLEHTIPKGRITAPLDDDLSSAIDRPTK